MSDPFVVISHPARQGYVYRVPMATQRAGIDSRFLTGLYYKPDTCAARMATALPFGIGTRLGRLLEKRRLPGLDPDRVVSVSGPLPEIVSRLTGSYRRSNAVHDRLAARWLERHADFGGPVVAHGFVDSCSRFLAAARRRGATTLLEMTLPPWGDEIIGAEHARLGLPYRGNDQAAVHAAEVALADYVIAQNAFSVDWLHGHGIARERIVLLPLGVDTERFRPPPDRREDGPFRVIFVGHQSIRKGLHLLLEAWQSLALADAELLLVGPVIDGIGADLHRRYAGAFAYAGVTPPDRLAELYRSADLLVCPSLFEGGPMVVLEAMASGLPCVVSRAACSVVRDGTDGLIVPVADGAALGEAIAALHRDRARARRMGEAARERALAFTWDRFSDRIAGFYRNAAAGVRPASGHTDLTVR
jgi:glycosyltransferase involved in cell wall biosynthesis